MRSRNRGEVARLEMTPMIDVVFQLLIFFIVTLQKQDIIIKCMDDAPHNLLIQTLNICTREGMSNLSVFSL